MTLNSILGNYIWIIGGSFINPDPNDFNAVDLDFTDFEKLTEHTSLIWSIKRHKWITGPQLPDEIKEDLTQTNMFELEAIYLFQQSNIFSKLSNKN